MQPRRDEASLVEEPAKLVEQRQRGDQGLLDRVQDGRVGQRDVEVEPCRLWQNRDRDMAGSELSWRGRLLVHQHDGAQDLRRQGRLAGPALQLVEVDPDDLLEVGGGDQARRTPEPPQPFAESLLRPEEVVAAQCVAVGERERLAR